VSYSAFHPAVRDWFAAEVGTPTAAQLAGWNAIASGRHTLIAAPTGSGKTLAAFLSTINDLIEEGVRAPLPDEVRVVYVSPLKALSADIHRNLAQPRLGIRARGEAAGLTLPDITTAVRTGDTTSSERAAMLRRPPHVLITTPESLYLLLTAEHSRQMLQSVRTVIVDEIHAVIGTRRGAHLALSLERLARVASRPLQRIGLSATQRPIEEVAHYLTAGDTRECCIVDEGHRRTMDLGVEMPRSALEAVTAHEVWTEYYDRLAELIRGHRTTLVFVNTRKMAERVARHLSERLGDDAVTAHHGSLSKEKRLDAEDRLKNGRLQALVATASLELGIDIGHIDLVCQLGSPHRIATLLQRVGRSGHTIGGTPKGRVFPTSRDDLVECAALLRSIRRGTLDTILSHDEPLDVLAQQIVAETAAHPSAESELFTLFRRAWPYRALSRQVFDDVLRMLAEGVATRKGRRSALVHRDEVNGVVRGRRHARLLAQTSGGAIPELADYRVILEPDETLIGSLNEDFAIESNAGDIFQLGNASWRVLQVTGGDVRVADAKGAPPNIPFWLGEAPARSNELSMAVSDLRQDIDGLFESGTPVSSIAAWLAQETDLGSSAAEQLLDYCAEGRRALGVIPSQSTLVLERFFDESGGMQLVLHAPFGSRVNKAWGLALRKRFCRQFNFELQAAATEDGLMLSLGPQHSFPLADVFRYLHPATTETLLVQAVLDAPVFKTRWRWNASISLAVPRQRGGKKVPPQLQRMIADDLMAAVFPDAAACLENIPGDREVPDHPLVNQTIRDCLHEAMDFDALQAVLTRVHAGELRLVARDTPEPSLFAAEILGAKPYAFLDDAPLEERRSHAVQSRRRTDPESTDDLGVLDPDAIARVRDEARPDPRDADELHDALLTVGLLDARSLDSFDPAALCELQQSRRAGLIELPSNGPTPRLFAVAAERLPEVQALYPEARLDGPLHAPASRAARVWSPSDAVVEILRGFMSIAGPVTASALAEHFSLPVESVDIAFHALESEGLILRGRFTAGVRELEWCDRTLLARIHRYTIKRLRAEIEPVSAADLMRFLFRWQHVDPATRLTSADGLREAIAILDGYETVASAWERTVLPCRLDGYDPSMLDMLCLTGEAAWGRLSLPGNGSVPASTLQASTPIALFLREHGDAWRALKTDTEPPVLSEPAMRVEAILRERGALFFANLLTASGLDTDQLQHALGALVTCGLVTSDGFSGFRALSRATSGKPPAGDRRSAFSGRWTLAPGTAAPARDDVVQLQALTLLKRYGIVCRRLLLRETNVVTWRELTRAYRRMEARGEIRGGRFVAGFSGEQFAQPEAVERMREVRRTPLQGQLIVIGTADPLNLVGIVTPGERIRAAGRNRLVYRDGQPIAVFEAGQVRELVALDSATSTQVALALTARRPALALT